MSGKRYIPTGGGFTAAEVVALARIVDEHGNPHNIPAIDSLARKTSTMQRWQNEDREHAAQVGDVKPCGCYVWAVCEHAAGQLSGGKG